MLNRRGPGRCGFDPHIFRVTPEEAVEFAINNARLSGLTIDAEHRKLLLSVASGEIAVDDAIASILKEYQ